MTTSEALCLACGFCCDGSLFASGPLLPEEAEPAARRGLRVFSPREGALAFRQPCAVLSAGRCAAYDDRPQTCRTYRCDLLAAHESGEVSLEEAQEIVAETRTAVDRQVLVEMYFVGRRGRR